MKNNMFGFTNNDKEYERVVKFRTEAIKDGWTYEPTYGNHESWESHCSLSKNDFKMSISTRTTETSFILKKGGKWKYEADIHIWGPDGLAIEPPKEYNMGEIIKGLKKCSWCETEDVETQRVAFANRVCKKCLPAAQKQLEYPGWCD